MDLIKSEKGYALSAKELHKELGIRKDYSSWIKQSIERAYLDEGKDYLVSKQESTGGRPLIDYILSIESAMRLIMFSNKTGKAIKLYKTLASVIETDVIQITPTRKELLFEIDIKGALKEITTIISQYPVLDYRVDFYLPDLNIAIEYDEKAHLYYKNDKERQTEIENYLQCHFIRVDEGFELEGINKIMKVVIFNILTDCWQNGKISEDQEGLMEILGEQMPKILNIK